MMRTCSVNVLGLLLRPKVPVKYVSEIGILSGR